MKKIVWSIFLASFLICVLAINGVDAQIPLFCDLSITKTGTPNAVMQNDTIEYTVSITNEGIFPCQGYTVQEFYDSTTTFLSADPIPTTGNDSWMFGTIAPNETQVINITVGTTNAICNQDVLNEVCVLAFQGPFICTGEFTQVICGAFCGNGITEPGEQCDDNNRINGDGCSKNCMIDSNQCETTELYVMDDIGSTDSRLTRFLKPVDTTTSVGPLHTGLDIEATAIHPITGIMYGFTGDEPDTKTLVVIDKDTGLITSTVLLSLNNSQEIQGASFHPITGVLYVGLDEPEELYTVNVTTGTLTLVRNLTDEPEALAWDRTGTFLYFWDNDDDLHRFDPINNTLDEICSDTFFNVEAMDFDFNNNMVIEFEVGNGSEIDVFDFEFCTDLFSGLYDVFPLPKDPESFSFFCNDCPRHIDADNDTIGDSCDMCPNTPAGQLIDPMGCSKSQFCRKLPVCGPACDNADWLGNVNTTNQSGNMIITIPAFPDCLTIIANQNGIPYPTCAPIELMCTV